MTKTQEQFLQEALDLKKANPELDIVFCTAYDKLCDDHALSCQQIHSVQILPWYEHNEAILTKEDEIHDAILDGIEEVDDSEGGVDWGHEEFNERYAERVKQKICVYLRAGGA